MNAAHAHFWVARELVASSDCTFLQVEPNESAERSPALLYLDGGEGAGYIKQSADTVYKQH